METIHRIHELLSDAAILRHQKDYGQATKKAEDALSLALSGQGSVERKEQAEIHAELGNIYFCDHLYQKLRIIFCAPYRSSSSSFTHRIRCLFLCWII